MLPRPYYSDSAASAAFYDLVTDADLTLAGDVELYASLAPRGGLVLELGSGTGRVSHALAQMGLRVVGLEIAPAMLAQAEAKRLALPRATAAKVRYVAGDMTDFALAERFDAVICPFYALAHLEPGPAWDGALAGVAAHLKPGGLAAFHVPGLISDDRLPPSPTAPVFRRPLAEGSALTLYVHRQTVTGPRMDLVLDYAVTSAVGIETSRSRERLTLYSGVPDEAAGRAGLVVDRPPIALGGAGFIHLYRRPSGRDTD
jgi:SAM-dependent methyltransferase